MTQRLVIFEDEFFDALDAQLTAERTPAGAPSRTDALAYVIPPLRDLLAEDYEANTRPVEGIEFVRTLIRSTAFIPLVTLFCIELDGAVRVFDVELDFDWPVGLTDPDNEDDE